jgi:hypothetical protein
MIKLKGCGRCGGDVRFAPDRDGVELYCLQCGARRSFTPERMRALAGAVATAADAPDPDRRAA